MASTCGNELAAGPVGTRRVGKTSLLKGGVQENSCFSVLLRKVGPRCQGCNSPKSAAPGLKLPEFRPHHTPWLSFPHHRLTLEITPWNIPGDWLPGRGTQKYHQSAKDAPWSDSRGRCGESAGSARSRWQGFVKASQRWGPASWAVGCSRSWSQEAPRPHLPGPGEQKEALLPGATCLNFPCSLEISAKSRGERLAIPATVAGRQGLCHLEGQDGSATAP